jgi:hypothetical protein
MESIVQLGAEAEGITRSFVNRILRLTLLAPGIVEAILGCGKTAGIASEKPFKPSTMAIGTSSSRAARGW